MFQLADQNTVFDYPVQVDVPGPGGRPLRQTFTAHFRLLPADELKDLTEDGVGDAVFLKRILAGWDDITDADGKPLKCTDANIEKLAAIGYFAAAVGRAYSSFAMGLPAKNSAPPRVH